MPSNQHSGVHCLTTLNRSNLERNAKFQALGERHVDGRLMQHHGLFCGMHACLDRRAAPIRDPSEYVVRCMDQPNIAKGSISC